MAPLRPRLSRSACVGVGQGAGETHSQSAAGLRSPRAEPPLPAWDTGSPGAAGPRPRPPRTEFPGFAYSDPFGEQTGRWGLLQERLGVLGSQPHKGRRGGPWREQCPWPDTAVLGQVSSATRSCGRPLLGRSVSSPSPALNALRPASLACRE